MYSFGYNNHGELGLGDLVNRVFPTLITALNNAIQISLSSQSTYYWFPLTMKLFSEKVRTLFGESLIGK